MSLVLYTPAKGNFASFFLSYFVCPQLYLMRELVFTFITMALAKYMAYFHYNFHCCTSELFVLIYVLGYCWDFMFHRRTPYYGCVYCPPC
jgi:hypothetical protein